MLLKSESVQTRSLPVVEFRVSSVLSRQIEAHCEFGVTSRAGMRLKYRAYIRSRTSEFAMMGRRETVLVSRAFEHWELRVGTFECGIGIFRTSYARDFEVDIFPCLGGGSTRLDITKYMQRLQQKQTRLADG